MGKIELDHTGTGGGITLSSDGTSLLLDGTAVGGGLELYAENPSTPTAPSATGTNAVAIGDGAIASGTESAAIGESKASGNSSFAVGVQTTASVYGATATGAIAIGAVTQASGNYSVALGYGNVANAQYGCAIGRSNTAGNYGTAIGGGSNACYGANSAVFGGESGYIPVNKSYSLVLNGWDSHVNESYSVAIGTEAQSDTIGKLVYASGKFAARGDVQGGQFILRSDTTDATAEALTTNNSTAGSTNQVVLPNNSAYFFSGTCVARESAAGGTDMGAWEFKGCIRREGTAASTTLVSSTIDEFSAPTGWSIALTADTTNGGLKVEVTGVAATNIRWVATVNTSEVTYA